ncbi:hypothetical protein [Lentibacillus sp. CBA3610]|uniref:hypothetical protein n=1 Tax=Lentibacillus sp. CBA3610 TaxID=2518176 RepID=UPI0015962666|nr:hypothetical protein [Lentibacillus sp. CBA3610]QKY71269.1 hypothetical protein Len3610_18465 [Lentibacillus sp. CBA3610]
MADYKYLGLTAYIKENEENTEKLNVLASAIDTLQQQVEEIEFNKETYQNVIGSDAFQYLYDHDYVCYPDESELPENTPEAYKRVNVQDTNIKNIPMLKLYLPAVAKNEDTIQHFMYNALHPVLIALFGNDILSIKTKSQIEYNEFQDGKEAVLTSVNDKTKVTA